MSPDLIPPHGGYSKLVTYKLGNLIYDATASFCEQFISRKDRTFDQMVQAARSGVANIIEGSEASATSKKTELKLTNVAKASQEELLADYLAFLRQRSLPVWARILNRLSLSGKPVRKPCSSSVCSWQPLSEIYCLTCPTSPTCLTRQTKTAKPPSNRKLQPIP